MNNMASDRVNIAMNGLSNELKQNSNWNELLDLLDDNNPYTIKERIDIFKNKHPEFDTFLSFIFRMYDSEDILIPLINRTRDSIINDNFIHL